MAGRLSDQTDIFENTDSGKISQAELIKDKTEKLAYYKSLRIKSYLERNEDINYPIWETEFITSTDKIGSIPTNVIQFVFNSDFSGFSQPQKTTFGYLLIKVKDVAESHVAEFNDVKEKIWLEYIKNECSNSFKDDNASYFYNNLNDFIAYTAIINMVKIPPSSRKNEIKTVFKNNLTDKSIVIEKYKLKTTKEIVFLERFSNNNHALDLIADEINKNNESGFVEFNDTLFILK